MALKGQAKILTFFWYAKEAEEAARFYASIFPGSRVDRVTPMMSESPSGPPGSVKVVDFTLFGQRFMAMTAGRHDDFNDALSLMIECEDQKELDRYWNAILENGGKEIAWLNGSRGPALIAMNCCPKSVNSTTATDPAGPLVVSAGIAVTRSTRESGKIEA